MAKITLQMQIEIEINHTEKAMRYDLEGCVTQTVITYDYFSLQKCSPTASEIVCDEFLGISFSHHMEILHKTKNINEVLFCIHEAVVHQWELPPIKPFRICQWRCRKHFPILRS